MSELLHGCINRILLCLWDCYGGRVYCIYRSPPFR